jgi:hypothetical protein
MNSAAATAPNTNIGWEAETPEDVYKPAHLRIRSSYGLPSTYHQLKAEAYDIFYPTFGGNFTHVIH